jgi:universal stress protein A
MKAKHILFPTDFSHQNDAALESASRLACESHGVLHILHVDDMPDFDAPLAVAGPNEAAADIWDRSKVQERLFHVTPCKKGVEYVHHYREGTAADEIVSCAENENIDLIVMASHGRTGLARMLLGSVAEEVLRRANCPVLIVKPPPDPQLSKHHRNERNSTGTGAECMRPSASGG